MSSFENQNHIVVGSHTRNGRLIFKPESIGGLNGVRGLGKKNRALLANGNILEICNNLQDVITTMPLDLFYALTNKAAAVNRVDGIFCAQLPAHTLYVAVKELVSRVSHISNPKMIVNVPLSDKLVGKVALNISFRSWKAELPNEEAFAAYLFTNERFGTAVNVYYTQWEGAQASHEAFLAREERQVKCKNDEARQKARQAEQQKREAKDAADAKTYAAVGALVREKMRHAGSKYTAAEARYIYSTFGRCVPVALGK
ncbi:hypothetical protein DE146DRAFT_757924 [Phaeosphaeria sp. MPI-PUGE-AT-0046c]|nr:hypothetical protein DE146DRAFT_757924 [Phaeosphaeria sp. MPI-PUGE-AT-0046c]